MKKFFYTLISFCIPCIILLFLLFIIFLPLLTTNSLVFPYAINPFDICLQYPQIWNLIKIFYFISFILCYSIVYIYILNNIHKYQLTKALTQDDCQIIDNSKLYLKIGKTENGNIKYIHENRFISKHSYNWYYWKWKNLFCYVSFHETTYIIFSEQSN